MHIIADGCDALKVPSLGKMSVYFQISEGFGQCVAICLTLLF